MAKKAKKAKLIKVPKLKGSMAKTPKDVLKAPTFGNFKNVITGG